MPRHVVSGSKSPEGTSPLTKSELIDALTKRTGIPSTKVRTVILALEDQLPKLLAEEGKIHLGGLGLFKVVTRGRKFLRGRTVSASEIPKFKPSPKFKAYIADRGWTRNKSDAA
jgi:nucleoid DNA-binding protein